MPEGWWPGAEVVHEVCSVQEERGFPQDSRNPTVCFLERKRRVGLQGSEEV